VKSHHEKAKPSLILEDLGARWAGRAAVAGWERELALAAVAPVYGLDTLLTKGDGGRDAVFGFPERALAGLGWVNFR